MNTRTCLAIAGLLAATLASAHAQLVEVNIARGKPASGDTAFGFTPANGNDGSTSTFNHADNLNPPPDNPYWAVDFGEPFDLVRIEIVDRIGCCDPNRLNGSEIRVFDSVGTQIGDTLLVDGLPANNPEETATVTFDNNGAGWPGAASIRVDGYTQYFQFSELRAISMQPPPPPEIPNVALTGIATASGPLWQGTTAASLVDGNPASFAHPDTGSTLGFTWTIDLVSSYPFESLEIVNRDNCCPERLSNYRVSLHEAAAGNVPGPAVWSTIVHEDGSDSGLGGVDILTADMDAAGVFAGRFITVENLSDIPYNPQIAEVRARSLAPAPSYLSSGKPAAFFDSAGFEVTAWPGLPASNVVDGSFGTLSHPQQQSSADYYFEVDLEAQTAIGQIEVAGRFDPCCQERLVDATLSILDESRNTVFSQELSGTVIDPVTVDAGGVTGRYVRITNTNGADYGPQLSEVHVNAPTGPAAPFAITGLTVDPATGAGTVTFTSQPGVTYTLHSSSDLKVWVELSDNVPSGGTVTAFPFTDSFAPGSGRRYFQVRRP